MSLPDSPKQALFFDRTLVSILRSEARQLTEHFELGSSPEQIWPIVSNTDLMNQRIGLAEPVFRFLPRPEGGTVMQVQARQGLFSLDYDELPFEWLAPESFWVERLFRGGAIRYLRYGLELKSVGRDQTQVSVSLSYVPRLPDWMILRVMRSQLNQLVDGLKSMLTGLSQSNQDPLIALLEADSQQVTAALDLAKRWEGLMPDSPIPEAVARYVMLAPERHVRQLRPLEIARVFNLDPLATLHFFLRASKAEFLQPQWDLLCTSCQGAKVEVSHLHEVSTQGACESCGISYQVGFDDNLEMTFQPAESVRSVSLRSFCAGGPANTPQIMAQANLWPHQQRVWDLNLEPGYYRLAALTMSKTLRLRVAEGGLSELELNLTDELPAEVSLSSDCQLILNNPTETLQTPRLESLSLKTQRVSAAQVTALQEFRDLFSRELLGRGVRLSLWQQSIVWLELSDLLPLYQELGDYLAGERLTELMALVTQAVREHQGAVVQTLPKGVMAVFQESGLALKAVIKLSEQLSDLQKLTASSPLLRAGLQQGSCMAFSNGEHLDYQGLTVQQAYALLQVAEPNQLLLPEDLYELPSLQVIFAESELKTLPETYVLADGTQIVRLDLSPDLSHESSEDEIPESLLEFMLE